MKYDGSDMFFSFMMGVGITLIGVAAKNEFFNSSPAASVVSSASPDRKPQRRTAVVNHFSAWDGMTVWSEEHGWEKVVRMSNTFDQDRQGVVCELEKVID